jgi:hypothetical protein
MSTMQQPVRRPVLAAASVYVLAFLFPLLVAGVLAAAPLIWFGAHDGVGGAIAAASALAGGVFLLRKLRWLIASLNAKLWPPLPLPGDLWNFGVPPPPKRSSNWPISLFARPRFTSRSAPGPDTRRP